MKRDNSWRVVGLLLSLFLLPQTGIRAAQLTPGEVFSGSDQGREQLSRTDELIPYATEDGLGVIDEKNGRALVKPVNSNTDADGNALGEAGEGTTFIDGFDAEGALDE